MKVTLSSMLPQRSPRGLTNLILTGLLTLAPALLHAVELGPGLYAEFTTSMGSFTCVLHHEQTPNTVANFVGLAEGTRAWMDMEHAAVAREPFYDGITFHRVAEGFVIQSGSRDGTGTDSPGYYFPDEIVPALRHDAAGVLSMANRGADTNGAQFFVTLAATDWLDDKHSVFGRVVDGMEVVEQIGDVPTEDEVPIDPVALEQVRILRIGEAAEQYDAIAAAPLLPRVNGVETRISFYEEGGLGLDWELVPRTRYMVFIGGAPDELYPWQAFWEWPGVLFGNQLTATEAFFTVIRVHYPEAPTDNEGS